MAKVYIEDDFVEVQRYGGFSLRNLTQNKELFLFRMAPGLINPSDLINKKVEIGKQKRVMNVNGKELQFLAENKNDLKNSSLLIPDSNTGKLQPIDRSIESQIILTRPISIEASDNVDLSPYETVKHRTPDLMERDFFRVAELPETWKKLKKQLKQNKLKALEKARTKQNCVSQNSVQYSLNENEPEEPQKKKKKSKRQSVSDVSVKEESFSQFSSDECSKNKKFLDMNESVKGMKNKLVSDKSRSKEKKNKSCREDRDNIVEETKNKSFKETRNESLIEERNKIAEEMNVSFRESKNKLAEAKNISLTEAKKLVKEEKNKFSMEKKNKSLREAMNKSCEEAKSFKEAKEKLSEGQMNKFFEETKNKSPEKKAIKEVKKSKSSSSESPNEEQMNEFFKETKNKSFKEIKNKSPEKKTFKEIKKRKRSSSESSNMEDMTIKEEPLFSSQETKIKVKQEPDSDSLERPKKKKKRRN